MTSKTHTEYEGGYYLIQEGLIRSGLHRHTLDIDMPISQATLDAVNVIQSTPWVINTWVLDVMTEAWSNGDLIGGLPSAENIPLPPQIDTGIWEAMSNEDRTAHKRRLAEIHSANAKAQSTRQSFLASLQTAQRMRDFPAIYFPHFVDFRGRIYPMTQYLSPQSDDISKSLLMFARGKELGQRGLYWLAVRLANTFGEDKLDLDRRVDWAFDHTRQIIDSANNPLDGARFWTQADEPWGFLATCYEWKLAMEMSNPTQFISHLPIPLDGSCNGLQHLSALGRDPVGAKATNLMDSGARQDIYMEVAAVVKRLVTEDAVAGVEEAHAWVGKINRKTVKRAVMTTPYGVTERGIRDQLVADGHCADVEVSKGAAANYLKDKIVQALGETVVAAKEIMAYFQATAKALADHNVPLRWTTPTGNRLQQSYHNLACAKVNTLMGEVWLWEEDPLAGLNTRKQMLASAPNIIHSLDASHLVLTVNACAAVGIDSFCMIHDSYGTHAADTDALSKILRQEFVKMYEGDWLAQFEAEVQAYAPEGAALPRYRDCVTLGDFDITQVLDAPFFFA